MSLEIKVFIQRKKKMDAIPILSILLIKPYSSYNATKSENCHLEQVVKIQEYSQNSFTTHFPFYSKTLLKAIFPQNPVLTARGV